jgi:phage gpG-like protein
MNINEFQFLIPKIKEALEIEIQVALTEIAAKIAEDARNKIGHEQHDWAELADATIASKEQKGEPTPDPLLATGELRDSIQFVVEGHTAVIGSDDPVAVYQELGTETIPPRPFLSSAAAENAGLVETVFETALRKAFTVAK